MDTPDNGHTDLGDNERPPEAFAGDIPDDTQQQASDAKLGADVQTFINTLNVGNGGTGNTGIIDLDETPGTIEERVAALEKRVAILTYTAETVAWLHAELMYKSRKAAAQQLLNNPEVKERLEQAVRERLEQALMSSMDT